MAKGIGMISCAFCCFVSSFIYIPNMHNRYFQIIILLFFIVGCKNQGEDNNRYNTVVQKFSKNFISEFGQFPSSHNWTTCTSKSISISANSTDVKKVWIYSSDPSQDNNGCRLMAEYEELSFDFDAPASLKEAYIVAELGDGRYSIVKTDCSSSAISATISSDGAVEPFDLPTNPMEYFLAYEGIGSLDDFDYNDVVLSIGRVSGQSKARFAVYAVGCTDAVEVIYKTDTERYIFRELHTTMGAFSTSAMINTVSDNVIVAREEMTNRAVTNTFEVGTELSVNEIAKKIELRSGELKISYNDSSSGNLFAPMAIIVANPTWKWPSEHTKISSGYPAFSKYVLDEKNNLDWCK